MLAFELTALLEKTIPPSLLSSLYRCTPGFTIRLFENFTRCGDKVRSASLPAPNKIDALLIKVLLVIVISVAW